MVKVVVVGDDNYSNTLTSVLDPRLNTTAVPSGGDILLTSPQELRVQLKRANPYDVAIFCQGSENHIGLLEDPTVFPRKARSIYCSWGYDGVYAATCPPEGNNYPIGFDFYLLGSPEPGTIRNSVKWALRR